MIDVQMTADLLIGMIEGIRSKKQIKKFYELYEKEFIWDTDDLEKKFNSIIRMITKLFDNNFKKREFRRPHVFYSLFMTLYHLEYGVENLVAERTIIENIGYARASQKLERIDYIFSEEDKNLLSKDEKQFLEDCRRATTDTAVRIRRSEFIAKIITE
jgi:hypothetical protein